MKLFRWRRMRLRRYDGAVYLDRWGVQIPWLGGIFLHRMDAADPGLDLHDHPWSFLTFVIWGGYTEERALVREAPLLASIAEHWPDTCTRGVVENRRPFTWRLMRLDECHRITRLHRRRAWTLVFIGPVRRSWGFYLPSGYIGERQYDETVRAERRDLWNEEPDATELEGRKR